MVVGIIGESCTGKSTLAKKLQQILKAELYTGKDYLRLAKSEAAATELFRQRLDAASHDSNIIYVISEKEHLSLLPANAIRVLITADLDTIKERFANRMHGKLPAPVSAMLEQKHGCFDSEKCDVHMLSGRDDPDRICSIIQQMTHTE